MFKFKHIFLSALFILIIVALLSCGKPAQNVVDTGMDSSKQETDTAVSDTADTLETDTETGNINNDTVETKATDSELEDSVGETEYSEQSDSSYIESDTESSAQDSNPVENQEHSDSSQESSTDTPYQQEPQDGEPPYTEDTVPVPDDDVTSDTWYEETDNYYDTEEVHVHDYNIITVEKEATCTDTGIMRYCCECGDYYEEIIDQLQHDFNVEYINNHTCLEESGTKYTCKICGFEYWGNDYVPAGNHSYVLVESRDSTETVEGFNRYVCSVCGDEYTDVIPMKTPAESDALPADSSGEPAETSDDDLIDENDENIGTWM